MSDQEVRTLKNAYRVADGAQSDVFLVTTPRSTIESIERINYVVLVGEADEWEKINGRLIQWRVQ